MKEYIFNDLYIGLSEHFSVTLTEEMHKTFTALSGDINPMHIDNDYAVSKGYSSCVVYGMLTSSFISTLAGCWLPGKYCLLQEVKTSFANPAYIGDTLTITGTVSELYENFRRAKIKVCITNQDNRTISRGYIVTGVLK